MLRWAIVFLVISLIAGGFGLANISDVTRKISFVLFGLLIVFSQSSAVAPFIYTLF